MDSGLLPTPSLSVAFFAFVQFTEQHRVVVPLSCALDFRAYTFVLLELPFSEIASTRESVRCLSLFLFVSFQHSCLVQLLVVLLLNWRAYLSHCFQAIGNAAGLKILKSAFRP